MTTRRSLNKSVEVLWKWNYWGRTMTQTKTIHVFIFCPFLTRRTACVALAFVPVLYCISMLWTKQIYLYRTSHTRAIRYRWLLYHGNMTCWLLSGILPLLNMIFVVSWSTSCTLAYFQGGGYRGYSKLIEISRKISWENFQNRKISKIFGPLMKRHLISEIFLPIF